MFDKGVNRLLVIKLRTNIVAPLNGLVEWDRYGIREDDTGFIFGWIKRKDGFYDFVVIDFALLSAMFSFSYTTSSKEYSEEIGSRLSRANNTVVTNSYLECRPASDIPEANLIKWQKGGELQDSYSEV